MKRRIAALTLVMAMLLSGCCYAPGNERASFIEKWLELPKLQISGYQSSKTQSTDDPVDSTAPVSGDSIAIEAPVVNLDEMPKREPGDFVRVRDYIPDLVTDLRYATSNNFTGGVVYDFTDVYLRYSTVLKLMKVQDELRQQGLMLKVWDGFRPLEAQWKLWNAKPDPVYVSHPVNGTNSHARGNTIDVTLVNAQGKEVEMPTGFDDFTSFADRDYSDCTDAAAANATLLQEIMEKYGFTGLQTEWWHFSDEDDYAIEKIFDPGAISLWRAECNEYINLRVSPDVSAAVLATIPDNDQFTVLGWTGNFAFIEYKDVRGYVNAGYISRVE
jgi:D-alanyl-D-alanine dipeptidase